MQHKLNDHCEDSHSIIGHNQQESKNPKEDTPMVLVQPTQMFTHSMAAKVKGEEHVSKYSINLVHVQVSSPTS